MTPAPSFTVVPNLPTSLVGSGIMRLSSGETSQIFREPRRKQFAVRNHSTSTGSLLLLDADGNVFDSLASGAAPYTLETSGDFCVSASGGYCDYSVVQIVFKKQ